MMKSIRDVLPNRRHCVSEAVGAFVVSVGFHPVHGYPIEVFITQRGHKAGESELDSDLYALGVAASKIMQGRPTDA